MNTQEGAEGPGPHAARHRGRTGALVALALLAGVGGGMWLQQQRGGAPAAATAAVAAAPLYTCGMHPRVIQDHPGNCPICGMKLTPIRKQPGTPGAAGGASAPAGERKIQYYKSTMTPGETRPTPGKDSMGMDMVPVYEDQAAGLASQTIAIDPVTVQSMGIRTALVTRGPLRRTIRTVGAIDYDERTLRDVTPKFRGWLEKLYVNETGQPVHRGDPLFEIYAPELYSAQVEYALAMAAATNGGAGAAELRASARTRLEFFDIPAEQIAELERTRQPQKTLRILAPQDGFVIDKPVVAGQLVEAGMRVYRLADLGRIWVQAQIYEQDLGYVKLGQEATMTLAYAPGREFKGKVTYLYPSVDEKTRTARVRLEFPNPDVALKPGMYATVRIVCELEASALLIPDMAVLRSGEKTTVFVAQEGGHFDPRTVTLGPQAEGDFYQVLTGLREGERVVTSGQFMMDSESQLREAIQKMIEPPAPAGVAVPAAPAAGPALYTCPMAEDDVVADRPGKCPKCGMALVPTGTVPHGHAAEEQWRRQHAAPAPAAAPAGPAR